MTIDVWALLEIFFIALIVPLVVQGGKNFFTSLGQKWKISWITKVMFPILNPMIWTIILCFAAKAGIFEAFGFVLLMAWLDYLVTAMVASLGASKLYDFVLNFRDYKDKLAVENAVKKE